MEGKERQEKGQMVGFLHSAHMLDFIWFVTSQTWVHSCVAEDTRNYRLNSMSLFLF